MLLAEYDYDTDIAVQRKEAFNDGFSAGEERGISLGTYQKAVETAKKFLSMGLSVEQVADGTGLSIEEIEKL
ncbi:MAG: hypothetical protein II258_03990 [Spirochaetales bacterium]|nr:hypothetical protein [Spirochaetales bacterium]